MTHARETFFCFAIVSSEAWVSDKSVTDILVVCSDLGFCAIWANATLASHYTTLVRTNSNSFIIGEEMANLNRKDDPASGIFSFRSGLARATFEASLVASNH